MFGKLLPMHWWNIKKIFSDSIDQRTYPIWDSCFITNNNLVKRSHEFESSGINYLYDLIFPTGELFIMKSMLELLICILTLLISTVFLHSSPKNGKNIYKKDLIQLVCINMY